jgi:hypothetical protein
MQAVHLDGPEELLGEMVLAEITEAHANSLAGQLAGRAAAPVAVGAMAASAASMEQTI